MSVDPPRQLQKWIRGEEFKTERAGDEFSESLKG
jgi:hypothetical protein